ncbi:MAG: M48 family metallopeptidase [Ruminococcus sp.]|nr:M48 family metallopeptidase [Ruminococcus sp.]
MIREVEYKGKIIKYNLEHKKVKNINLRIKPDMSVSVSANKRVSLKYIDEFVLKKADFILNAFKTFEDSSKVAIKPNYSEQEFYEYIDSKFDEVYEIFKAYNINKPILKFKKMKSRWGSCNYVKSIITLNTNLIYCTKEQIEYVIIHEYSHLIIHNHSKEFYEVVEKFCKDYKRIRKEMNKIYLG